MRRLSAIASVVVLMSASLSSGCGPAPDSLAIPAQSPSARAKPAPAPAANQLTIAAAGDLLVHPDLTEQAAADARAANGTGHDFTKVFEGVRPALSNADIAICHMETPLAAPNGPFTGYPIFSVPPQLADGAAWAGFDTCSTASNHSLDTGTEGIKRTLDNLDRVGLKHSGTARTPQEAARINMINVNGIKVAQLSYTETFNGLRRPAGRNWVANLIEPDTILAEAAKARRQGAEIVVLSMHWGTEYQNAPNMGQTDLAKDLLASPDIDLIVGHHAHVVQPFEKIDDEWVAYGLGNLMTRFPDGSNEITQDAVIARFTFSRPGPGGTWRVSRAEAVPTFMQYEPRERIVNVAACAADPSGSANHRARCAAITKRINGVLGMRGATRAGLRITDGEPGV